jgi:hypothetical protein
VLLALALGLSLRLGGRPRYVATLADGKACKWDGGTLPTEVGARLTAGRLRLAEGVARVVFDGGAEVTVEGPADLELVSPHACVLHNGRLVARVPPPAVGFTVDTPTAVLKDLGTEFGAHVRDAQTVDVQVFNGVVDAHHRGTGKAERMRTGSGLRFLPGTVSDYDMLAEGPAAGPPALPGGPRVIHISTAAGRGKEAYVQPGRAKKQSDVLLLIKNTPAAHFAYFRKAYVGLDLAAIAGLHVLDAQLTFTFAPTGLGFASEVPDATFAVYGWTDEALDGWDERTIHWDNAPANRPGGAELDAARVVRLGTFEMAQGVLGGARSVAGPALVDFLNRKRNGVATFIVVRETPGSGRNDLVHGFANRRHPSLPPPTLRLTVAPR